ncbi:peptidase M4 family protein, partial [Pseudomonas syringae pv. actinidiae]|nr:peptidase M4 family protein [Pseudomonas syringae pv. actinidiae]
MCDDRNPLHCFIPPYMLERMAQSPKNLVSARAIANLTSSSAFLASRLSARAMPSMHAIKSPDGKKHRAIHDAKGTDDLPGVIVRKEGQAATGDKATDEAYDGSGDVYDFYAQLFKRNSLDDNGMSLVSTVHVAEVDFNGSQMAYGDGD